MISIFNRKELLITYDMKIQSDVRTVLKNHEIRFQELGTDTKMQFLFRYKITEK